jgi:hypothetical protein
VGRPDALGPVVLGFVELEAVPVLGAVGTGIRRVWSWIGLGLR